jgi:mono/diheme cytochrome c family protein
MSFAVRHDLDLRRSVRTALAAVYIAIAAIGGAAYVQQKSDAQSNQPTQSPASDQKQAGSQSRTASIQYTQAQASSGRELYRKNCASCHGNQLQGGAGAPLAGAAFTTKWSDRTVKDLYTFVHQSMPMSAPGSLSDQQYSDIIAYILQRNGFPSGSAQLTAQSSMDLKLQASPAKTSERGLAVSQQNKDTQTDWHAGETQEAKPPSSSGPTQAELDRADDDTHSWLMYNKGYQGHRYSKLAQIDTRSASQVRARCVRFKPERPALFNPVRWSTIARCT